MLANRTPFEIVGFPFRVFVADALTPEPSIEVASDNLPAAWSPLGTSGDENYAGDGVKVDLAQSFKLHKGPNSLTPIKAFRTSEDIMASFELADFSMDVWQKILNGNAIVRTNAMSMARGFRKINLLRGPSVLNYALLVRGQGSPYFDAGEDAGVQFYLPVCFYSAEKPGMTGRIDDGPNTLPMEFQALKRIGGVAAEALGSLIIADEGSFSLALSLSASQVGQGDPVTATATVTGGNTPITYAWTEPDNRGVFSSTSVAAPTFTVGGAVPIGTNVTLSCTVTDADGDAVTETVTFEVIA